MVASVVLALVVTETPGSQEDGLRGLHYWLQCKLKGCRNNVLVISLRWHCNEGEVNGWRELIWNGQMTVMWNFLKSLDTKRRKTGDDTGRSIAAFFFFFSLSSFFWGDFYEKSSSFTTWNWTLSMYIIGGPDKKILRSLSDVREILNHGAFKGWFIAQLLSLMVKLTVRKIGKYFHRP